MSLEVMFSSFLGGMLGGLFGFLLSEFLIGVVTRVIRKTRN